MFPRTPVLLNPTSIFDDGHWESVRKIRNACAEFMTDRTTPIDWEEQNIFRWQLNAETDRVFLLLDGENCGVGFMYLRYRNGTWVPTYGIDPAYRKRGHGEFLVRYSQLLVPHITLSVRRDNWPAIALYDKCGFEVLDEDCTPLQMEWVWD